MKRACNVCHAEFDVQFRYQTEVRNVEGSDRLVFFCSQACLSQSASGSVRCSACAREFTVELAAQVLYVGAQRHYACSDLCRAGLAKRPTPAAPAPRRGAGARVVAVFNHKGRTGKTTTAVTVAAGLAARGSRVLLVDTDSQGNVAASLALRHERSLYHVLVMGLGLADAVVEARPGLDVLPANETLAAAELYLAGRRQRDRVLSERLSAARDAYDFVIVDCSPSLSLMNQNALAFADAVLCPVACDYLSLIGVRQVLRTLRQVGSQLGHRVELWGVLPTQFDARARICHEALATLREHFGERCLSPVRLAIKVKEAPAEGKTLFEYAPGSSAACDYDLVVDKLLDSVMQSAPREGAPSFGGVA